MSEYATADSLGLEVTDFGPVIQAKIDLHPLMVFVGPSNTGKFYVAILIYALHRYFSGSDRRGALHTCLSSCLSLNMKKRHHPKVLLTTFFRGLNRNSGTRKNEMPRHTSENGAGAKDLSF